MKAIFDNKVYDVIEASGNLALETATGELLEVEYGDERLIVEPTDNEVADADNLAEHYGIDDEAARELRRMLRGEISVGQWQDWKAETRRF